MDKFSNKNTAGALGNQSVSDIEKQKDVNEDIGAKKHNNEKPLSMFALENEDNDCVKTYHVEDTPICLSSGSSVTNLSTSDKVKFTEERFSDDEILLEDNDKFDESVIAPSEFLSLKRPSGLLTPRTPMYQESPMMMYSPTESRSSLDSWDQNSFQSEVASEPASRLQSGYLSESELPDSPGHLSSQSQCSSPTTEVNDNLNAINNNVILSNNQLPVDHPASFDLANTGMQAGYTTTLPASDELKYFNLEGTFSPLTELSEISALCSNNNGFQRSNSSNDAHILNVAYSSCSYPNKRTDSMSGESKTCKSSISEASNVETDSSYSTSKMFTRDNSSESYTSSSFSFHCVPFMLANDEVKTYCKESVCDSPMDTLSEISALRVDNDGFQKNEVVVESTTCEFFDTSSDDEGLLEKAIASAIPKKKSKGHRKSPKVKDQKTSKNPVKKD